MRRWWEVGERSLDDEIRWISEGGFEFEFDRAFFQACEVVRFTGHLRLGDASWNWLERSPAILTFPPGYDAGEHPSVVAPELDLGRHRAPDGALCLTHDVLGTEGAMWGAEAISRAERLWWLWVHDRAQLDVEEADAPDPFSNYVDFSPNTSVAFIDIDVAGGNQGYLRVKLQSVAPLRGAVSEIRTTHPTPAAFSPGMPAEPLVGPLEANGAWMRLDAPPPSPLSHQLISWLLESHRGFVDRAVANSRADAAARDQSEVPAVIGFVYPDEGPKRRETHDAWILLAIHPDGRTELPRPARLVQSERWLRQPQLQPLERTSVGIVGIGANGSQIAELLARAGVGRFVLVDFDIFGVGNRVRHDLDLASVGQFKIGAVTERIRQINPWAVVEAAGIRFGFAHGIGSDLQRLNDRVAEMLTSCDLVINASAHGATGTLCSRLGAEEATNVLHSYVTAGAWGGRILAQRAGVSGCWDCLGLHQDLDTRIEGVDVPEVSDDPEPPKFLEAGCADPLFTGPGFEIAEAATATTRFAVQLLVQDDGYPTAGFDLITLNMRTADCARPNAIYTNLPPHPECRICAT